MFDVSTYLCSSYCLSTHLRYAAWAFKCGVKLQERILKWTAASTVSWLGMTSRCLVASFEKARNFTTSGSRLFWSDSLRVQQCFDFFWGETEILENYLPHLMMQREVKANDSAVWGPGQAREGGRVSSWYPSIPCEGPGSCGQDQAWMYGYIYVIWMGHCPVILSTPVIGHHTSRKDSFWIDQSCNSCISFGLLAGVTLWISCRMPCWRCTGINATRAIRINGYHFFYWVPSFVFVVIDQLYKSCSHEAGFPVPTGRTPHCPVPCSPWTIQINARRGQWLV